MMNLQKNVVYVLDISQMMVQMIFYLLKKNQTTEMGNVIYVVKLKKLLKIKKQIFFLKIGQKLIFNG